jgi:hypothetical protein
MFLSLRESHNSFIEFDVEFEMQNLHYLEKEIIMKSKLAVAMLGVALVAPTVAFAEASSIDDATLKEITSQKAYDDALAKRAQKQQVRPATSAAPVGAPHHSPARDAEINRIEQTQSR